MAPVSVTYGTDYTLNPVAKTSANNEIKDADITLKYYTDEACQKEWRPSADETKPTAAGIYWAKASLTGTDNYADAEEVVKVEILNATFTVSATGYSGTYDGKARSISVDAGNAVVTYSTDGENYTAENPSFTDAGTYTVYYKAVKANHEDVLGSAEVKITKAAAKLELSAPSGPYRINRGPVTFTYEYNGDGAVTVESSDTSVAEASVDAEKKEVTVTLKSVGTARITVSAAEGNNFLAKDATYDLTVQKKKSSSSSSATTTDKDKDNNKTTDNDKATDNNQTKDDNNVAEKSKVIKLQIGSRIVNVDNEAVIYDAAPVIRNDRTLVPIRIVTETLGGKVDWNGVTKEVTLNIDGKEIKMTVGKTLEKYGVAPVIIDGRTFVPVRFVADELGATVAWDDATKTVTIAKIEK